MKNVPKVCKWRVSVTFSVQKGMFNSLSTQRWKFFKTIESGTMNDGTRITYMMDPEYLE